MQTGLVVYSQEVSQALSENRPIVALESSVIAQGLPHPTNIETALAMETAAREAGATPATIAILAGQIHVGLTAEQIQYLGERPPGSVRKVSRRDLALVTGLSEDGATTVSATMIIAKMAGIEIFATGGIGGVHRGHPYDVSADLTELGRTNITVVCSGYKSILDMPRTRELLETYGVTIIGYRTWELPAFFSLSSGLRVDQRLDEPQAIAAVIRMQRQMSLQSALLVTVPVPAADAMPAVDAEAAIEQATEEADEQGISGAQTTPWLLNRVAQITQGRSMAANLALLSNNASVAAQIAAQLIS